MKWAEYYRAVLPECYTIFGVRLRPLSIGHLILLNRIESKIVSGNNPEPHDYFLAALICSLDYRGGLQLLEALGEDRNLVEIVRQINGISGWRRVAFHLGIIKPKYADPIKLAEAMRLFGEYIQDHTRQPAVTTKGNGRDINLPALQMMRVVLTSKLGYSQSEVLDCSYIQAVWDFITFGVIEGKSNLMEENDMAEIAAELEKLDARLKEFHGTA